MSTSIGEFTIDGRTYPMILPTDMTLGEQRELKRISQGMTPMEALDALRGLDPDAMAGVLLVSMRRVDPSVKDTAVDDVETGPLMIAIAAALRAAAAAVPPTPAGAAAEEAAPASS